MTQRAAPLPSVDDFMRLARPGSDTPGAPGGPPGVPKPAAPPGLEQSRISPPPLSPPAKAPLSVATLPSPQQAVQDATRKATGVVSAVMNFGKQQYQAATTPLPQLVHNALPDSWKSGTRPPTAVELYDEAMSGLASHFDQDRAEQLFDKLFGTGSAEMMDKREFPWAKWIPALANETIRGGLGLLDFGTTPVGMAVPGLSTGAGPAVKAGTGAAFGALQYPGTKQAILDAKNHPDTTTLSRAIVQSAVNLLPLAGAGKMGVDKIADAADLDAHNAIADKLLHGEQDIGRKIAAGRFVGERVAGGKPIEVEIDGKAATIQPLEPVNQGSQTGRPGYAVVRGAAGKTLFAGNGESVQNWIRSRQPAPPSPLELSERDIRQVAEASKRTAARLDRSQTGDEAPLLKGADYGKFRVAGTPEPDAGNAAARYPESQPTGEARPNNAPITASRPSVPASGAPDNVTRAMDARERLSGSSPASRSASSTIPTASRSTISSSRATAPRRGSPTSRSKPVSLNRRAVPSPPLLPPAPRNRPPSSAPPPRPNRAPARPAPSRPGNLAQRLEQSFQQQRPPAKRR